MRRKGLLRSETPTERSRGHHEHEACSAMRPPRCGTASNIVYSPYPSILPSKSRIPKDSVSILINSLKILEGIGEAIPVGGGTVKAIAKIGIALLEVGEKARVARSECLDLLEKTVNQILLIKPHLVAREPMSDDLQERLERYHDALNDAVQPLEQLCVKSKAKMPFTSTRIQEEVDDLRDKLNDAYQTFIFHSWISVDSKMTEVLRGMNALSISHNTQIVSRPGEADEIPMRLLEFGEQIACVDKKTHIFRVEKGSMLDLTGNRQAVILRRFEVKPEVKDEGQSLEEFKKEVELRGDLLNRFLSRMLGVATSSTGRTKMIVIEAGLISAYDYLQCLSGFEYPLEYSRIMCEFVAGYKFLREHRRSWRGGYQDVLLSATDKRLCMGGLGRMDSQWEDSGWRMNEAFLRLRLGFDGIGGGSGSFEFYADLFERMREAMTKWSEEKTEANGRDLRDRQWLWSTSSEIERGTENSPAVGEIGWVEGNRWNQIPLWHQFP